MGNCSTDQQHIVAPQQSTLLQPTSFSKPPPSAFIIPPNLCQPKLPYSNHGILANYTNIGHPISQPLQSKDLKLSKDNKLFLDNTFKADKNAIGDKFQIANLIWKRPAEFNRDQLILHEGEVETYNLKQGKLQNSYFVSAVAALSHRKEIFKNLLFGLLDEEEDPSANGAYTVWLFVDGKWKSVIVDDLLPTAYNQYVFSTYGKELWIAIIEKAYAKTFKSYENINKGLLGPMLTTLTGAPYEYANTNSKKLISADDMWKFIRTSFDKNYIISVCTECNDRNQYLQRDSTFSYTLLDCQEVYILTATNKKLQRIVKLENPWGRYEWKGRWSEYSDVWSEELRHELGYEKADESILWINVQDLVKTFGQVCICKYVADYKNTSLALRFNDEIATQLKGVFINVQTRTQGFISLVQKDYRHYFKNYKYSMARLILLAMDKDKGKLKSVLEQKMDCDYYTTIPIELNPGIYYLLVEMDWNCNFTRQVTINIYADNSVNLVQDINMPTTSSLFYQLALIDQSSNKAVEVYTYPHDPNIKRVTGKFGGYVYYHYFNNSTQNKYLSEIVKLHNCKNIKACGENNEDQFAVKLMPGEEKLIKMKITNEGNGQYEFKPITNNMVVERYSAQNLLQLLKKKPTKVRQREVENENVQVFVKMFEYAGGVALLYQNKMSKYSFIEEITFENKNLQLQNDSLDENCRYHLQLQPHSEKLLSFLVIDPSKNYAFKTTVEYYLSTPQFRF